MSSHKPKKKNRMKKFSIAEISGVDSPAMEGARALLMKRNDQGDATKNFGDFVDPKLTSVADGHQHVIDDSGSPGGETTWNQSEGDDNGHTHPWVRNTDGTITVGMADGHSHTILDGITKKKPAGSDPAAVNKKKEKKSMDPNEETTPTAEDLEAVNKDLERSNGERDFWKSFAALPGDQLAYAKTLEDALQQAFVSASDEDRASIVSKSLEADKVVYTDDDGNEFRKSDDERLVAAAKRADVAVRIANGELAKSHNQEYVKRATSELGNLAGEEKAKVNLLKAIDTIEKDEDKTAVLEVIKSANSGLAKAFTRTGTSAGASTNSDGSSDVLKCIDDLATKYAKDNSVSHEVAYGKVLETQEGADLYKQTVPV